MPRLLRHEHSRCAETYVLPDTTCYLACKAISFGFCMRILPFRRPAPSEHLLGARDWSQQELADFYRAHRLLVQNGVSIGLDRGLSDVGEPWMVFYDTATQDVFLHIARIDGRCVLVCETLRIKLNRATIHDIITAFEGEVRQVISLREERSSNVLLHPASRIIMSISAVFLLFKLENSQAHAKGIAADGVVVDTTRKQDMSASARVHQVLGRLLDMTDTPAAAAALAGAILTLEFARNQLSEANAEDVSVAEVAAPQHDGSPIVQNSQADEQAPVADPLEAQIQTATSETVEVVAVDLDAKVEIALVTAAHAATPATATAPAETAPAAAEAVRAEATEAVENTRPSSSGTTSVAAAASAAVSTPVSPTDTLSASASTPVEAASLATSVIKPLMASPGQTGGVVGTLTAGLLTGSDVATRDESTMAITVMPGIGDVTVANLDLLDDMVGLFRETKLSGDALTSTLVAFMSSFGTYDVEIANGRVLIEQHDAWLLSSDDVGIWTNVMEDDSAISVVGSLSLIGDLTLSFA